ncbi:MAG: NAD(P)-dependent glycerol-3-phosphate dehydrogenase [Atopobiaceae bacterium]|nr:NAD(P)-dependent glycerol-3-phosphate dehydrogenase [Atopobiaceae bacterium]
MGSGTWGTAACCLVSPHVDEVCLWARRESVASGINQDHRNPVHLPDLVLPRNVCATSSLSDALRDASDVVLAVPSAFVRTTMAGAAPHISAEVPLLVLTKGMESGTGMLMVDLVADVIGNPRRLAALSGPNHAEEVAQGKVSAAVIASLDPGIAEHFQQLFVSEAFRAYASSDLVGVEVCGAAKNVIAIAAGIAAGLGAGDNTLAALMTRGLAEMGRLSAARGGDPLTCMGLAGMGDLVVTCTSRHSRNRSFGEAFAAGESLADYESRTGMVVEGAQAALSLWEMAHAMGIEAPITDAVHDLLYEGAELADAIGSLLTRTPHVEFYGMGQPERPDND